MEKNKSENNDPAADSDLYASITEQEIINLWRRIKMNCGVSDIEAWNAIVAGSALDMLFAKPKPKNLS